ncbi:MAG: hypothetical protein ABIS01_00040 [Ferruginibacter sp.]
MLSEIKAMPEKAKLFLAHTKPYNLPLGVPYIGMGSSYFAPLAFKYMGIKIYPEIAAEFYNYLHAGEKLKDGVLISQSGRSTEVLWCAELFEHFTAISNDTNSTLCKLSQVERVIPLLAGDEHFSSSKTYINTLLALFTGFNIDISKAVDLMAKNEAVYEAKGMAIAEEIYNILQSGNLNGIYITGSGPNIATALQAALIMSESTKLNFHGLPMAQYDHGPKETAKNSIVINILAKGKSYERGIKLNSTIKAAGAHVFTVEEPAATEAQSVLNNIVPFNYMAYYLSQKLQIKDMFVVGGKVTEVSLL